MSAVFPAVEPGAPVIVWTDAAALARETALTLVNRLPAPEQARFARFQHARSAHEFLVGRLIARQWLETLDGTPAPAWTFREGPHGRPDVASPLTPFRFNLAHSGGVVACLMSHGVEAGVDVEDLDRRPVDPDLWHRYCAPSEVADIEAQPVQARQTRFLTYWTLKEAYLKALGLGIAVHLADVAFDLSTSTPRIRFHGTLAGTSTAWHFGMDHVAPHHLVSWAWPQIDGRPAPTVHRRMIALEALLA